MSTLRSVGLAAVLLMACPLPAPADEVTDALDAVRAAYAAGDIARALDELGFAQALLSSLRADGLSAFLPPAPAGWSREVSTETTGAMALAGGGMATEGSYSGAGNAVTITMLGDSPMMMAMAPMLANPMMATAAGGKLHRIGDARVLERDGEMFAVIANRILIRASGDAPEVMLSLLEAIDYPALEDFAAR